MDSDSRRRSVKVVRVLCDGCERASASVYCTECKESACSSCAEQLHVRGRRSSKRNCKGRSMKDLQKAVGVLALCSQCRTRPAYRYSNGEVYGLCQECRVAAPPQASGGHDVVKRAIADELRRASKSSSSHGGSSSSSGSRRRQKNQHGQSQHQSHKSRRGRTAHEDDSTGDDITDMTFSREGSTE